MCSTSWERAPRLVLMFFLLLFLSLRCQLVTPGSCSSRRQRVNWDSGLPSLENMTCGRAEGERERGRVGRKKWKKLWESVDKVKLKWTYLCLNIRCVCYHNLHHFHIQNHAMPFISATFAKLHHRSTLYCVTSSRSILLFFIVSSISALYLNSSTALLDAMERLNALNGDSFQPFPGPLQIVACLCFCFFFSSPFFWYHISPAWHKGKCVASLSLWSCNFICVSLMAISHYPDEKLLTIDRECLFNHQGYSISLSLSVYPSVCLNSPCFHMCPLARLPLAEQLRYHSPLPPFKEGGWHIVSSHFVLGVVSNGLWKDGSHLSPCCLWRMATCLHFCSDGPRPLFAGAEWDVQLPKRRAGLRTVLLLFLPAHYD